MLDIEDIKRFAPIIRLERIMREAGICGATIRRRIEREREFLTVEESKKIIEVLKKYGIKIIRESSD